ncbi:hypothetical protein CLOM_g19197, partial [Closterium sp. NIES-68]
LLARSYVVCFACARPTVVCFACARPTVVCFACARTLCAIACFLLAGPSDSDVCFASSHASRPSVLRLREASPV